MLFAILNESTMITDADGAKMTAACQLQMTRDLAPAWGRLPASLVFIPKGRTMPDHAEPLVILDHPDQADALGYHDETKDGKIYGRIFCEPVLSNDGVILAGATADICSIASVLSHEVAEQFCDPNCNSWVDASIRYKGKHYDAVSLEVADPVETLGYFVTLPDGSKIGLSDFVLPTWFDPHAPKGTQFNFLNTLTKPFGMTDGGYLIVRNDDGEAQIDGEKRPAWRTKSKLHSTSRTTRRTHQNLV